MEVTFMGPENTEAPSIKLRRESETVDHKRVECGKCRDNPQVLFTNICSILLSKGYAPNG